MSYTKESFVVSVMSLMIATSAAMAGQPVFTIIPKTPTSLSVYTDQTTAEQIKYRVTNQSNSPHRLQLLSLPQGFTQLATGQGNCGTQFTLQGGQFCNLVIEVTGSRLSASTTVKPQVCQVSPNGTPSPYLCYQSSAANAMNVTLLPATADSASLTISTGFLGLSVNNTALNAALTGQTRTFTITNQGPAVARNIRVTALTPLPSGTTLGGTCDGTANLGVGAGNACTVTVIPGSTPTVPAGATPDPSVLLITGDNASALTPDVDVLTYGNIYQQGYIFAINDATSTAGSIGGSLGSLQNPGGAAWGNPSITTNATSNTNGVTNTLQIIAAQGDSLSYAPSLCASFEVDSSGNTPCSSGVCYNDWYLPAVCEIAPNSTYSSCATGSQNMVTTIPTLMPNNQAYWTSTEVSTSTAIQLAYFSGSASLFVTNKANNGYNYYCARPITP